MIPTWLVIAGVLTAGLFAVKALFVVSTALALPATGGALFVTTSRVRQKAFLDAVPMDPGERFVDLGCGDGRVLRRAARRYKVRCIGYEVNLFAWTQARVLSLFSRRVRIVRADFFKKDLSGADVVFCYLFPDVAGRVAEKLKGELTPGARVASANFPLPGWTPEDVLRPTGGLHHDPIYIYRVDTAF